MKCAKSLIQLARCIDSTLVETYVEAKKSLASKAKSQCLETIYKKAIESRLKRIESEIVRKVVRCTPIRERALREHEMMLALRAL